MWTLKKKIILFSKIWNLKWSSGNVKAPNPNHIDEDGFFKSKIFQFYRFSGCKFYIHFSFRHVFASISVFLCVLAMWMHLYLVIIESSLKIFEINILSQDLRTSSAISWTSKVRTSSTLATTSLATSSNRRNVRAGRLFWSCRSSPRSCKCGRRRKVK